MSEREPLDESFLGFLTHHVVVPAAVIAMVASFLFYLVDVRSAYLGGGASLKWIGFCFVVATVLIERYNRAMRATSEADVKGCYSGALAAATIAVMIASPWDPESGKAGQVFANLLIVGAVWHFATRVTRELSPEIDRAPQPRRTIPQIYGGPSLPIPDEKPPVEVRNPAARVAQLAAIALLIFALTEPVLLAAVPQTGVKALAAVVVFLFSTGVVLAAGSTLDALRRAERAGAWVRPGLVPGRVALAALFLAMVLSAGLALPGLDYQGTGRLKPPATMGEGVEENRGNQETLDPARPSETMPKGDLGEEMALPIDPSLPPAPGGSLDETPPPPRRQSESTPSPGPAAGMLSLLARIGKWLLIPLILLLAGAALWGLVRLWPLLAGWRSRTASRWRAFLDRLAGLFYRPHRPSGPAADPFKGLDALLGLPDREAVLAAYHRFLLLLESLGHERPGKATPYEILAGLPANLKPLETPARVLT
ncbi:MAG: hypothetical protein ABUT39_09690, partial [Acidobacteriota bacterium]